MDMNEEAESADPEQSSDMSPQDQLTYDPTQGTGTPAWELSRKMSMEVNAQMRRN